MKIIHVLSVAVVTFMLLGCEEKTESKLERVSYVSDLGGYTILAYIDKKDKVVTLYEGAGVVALKILSVDLQTKGLWPLSVAGTLKLHQKSSNF